MSELPKGFIPHDGGTCPVPLDSKPAIMVRSGEIESEDSWPASFWAAGGDDWWRHQGNPRNNIIAYKPTQQEPKP